MTIKSHTFDNGDRLILDSTNDYEGFHGLMVYTVSYLEKNTYPGSEDTFYACNPDTYMSEAAAIEGYEKRFASENPFQALQRDIFTTNFVSTAFTMYLGEALLPTEMRTNWDRIAALVQNLSFSKTEEHLYDGAKIHVALQDLRTLSIEMSRKHATVMLEISALKLLQLLTAITTFALVVNKAQQKA